MSPSPKVVFLCALCMVVVVTLGLRAQTQTADPVAHATQVLNDIASAKFDKVEAQYDPSVSAALPPGGLAAAWGQITAQVGPFKSIARASSTELQGRQVVTLVSKFERTTLDTIIAFTPDGHIAGLRFVPHAEAAAWEAPGYVNRAAFQEQPIVVAFQHWQLPGTLTLPNGSGLFPAVVLIQGSGPHDADETIGPNKPFKDLAWGLASRHIAVLRYTKRTKQYGIKSSDDPQALTVNDEVINDGRAAVALAAKEPGVDSKRVYLLGHSLGGYLAPRIADGDPQIAGLVILAGSTRPMEQIVVEQYRYLATLPGAPAEQMQAQIAAAEQNVTAIESPDLAKTQTVELAGVKVPASYFLDLRGYRPAEVAAGLKIPILILQGGRDYQVTLADYDGWKQGLAAHPNVTFRLYTDFTHLFMPSSSPGTGLGTPQDYAKAGHVDPQVILDIASWIESGGRREQKP